MKILSLFGFAIIFTAILFACKKKEPSLSSPAGLTVTNITDTSCTITWGPVNGATSYKITLALDAAFNTPVFGYNQLVLANTTIDIKVLTPYTKYYVRVVAYKDNVSSSAAVTNFMTLDADGLVILPWYNDKLYAFNAKNGNVKWTFTGAQFYATPIIQDSVIYIGGVDGRLYALNVADGSQKWRSAKTTNASFFSANALVRSGVVYIGDYSGRCYAYNANDGSMKWSYDVPSPYKNINSSAVLNGNTVYFASYDGKIYALDAGTGVYKWATANTGNPISSGMCLVNGIIYVGAQPKVYAFDATTGTTKWVTASPQFTGYSSSPTVADNKVFIGGEDGVMYAFNISDGTIAWSKVMGTGSLMSSPIYKNGIIYIGGGDGKMYALQSSSGNAVWQNNTTGSIKNIYSGPTLSERALYFGTLDGGVLSINIQTGVTKWSNNITGARFQSSPSVITYKGDVYYPGLSGEIH